MLWFLLINGLKITTIIKRINAKIKAGAIEKCVLIAKIKASPEIHRSAIINR